MYAEKNINGNAGGYCYIEQLCFFLFMKTKLVGYTDIHDPRKKQCYFFDWFSGHWMGSRTFCENTACSHKTTDDTGERLYLSGETAKTAFAYLILPATFGFV